MEVWSLLIGIVQSTTKNAERDIADLSITAAQYLVLWEIDEHGPQRQTDLAARLRTTEASVSQMVGRMESGGLVARHSEGRARVVGLTDEGRSMLELARPRHAAHIARSFDRLTASQLVELHALLRRLADPPK
ncbi:MAG: MarR family transcriptional regulator [Actinomycetota bacterium]